MSQPTKLTTQHRSDQNKYALARQDVNVNGLTGAANYIAVGLKRRDLRGPVADDRIFFAGEATHEENPATVVGALQEGERAALAIHAINGQISHTP